MGICPVGICPVGICPGVFVLESMGIPVSFISNQLKDLCCQKIFVNCIWIGFGDIDR